MRVEKKKHLPIKFIVTSHNSVLFRDKFFFLKIYNFQSKMNLLMNSYPHRLNKGGNGVETGSRTAKYLSRQTKICFPEKDLKREKYPL